MGYIYLITNLVNKKTYIGQTRRSYQRRWYEHLYKAKNGTHLYAINQAINKYGEENFSFEVLEQCDDKLLDEKEKEYIKKYHSLITENGYNINLGGNGNIIVDREKVSTLWLQGLAICDIAKEVNSTYGTVSEIVRQLFPNSQPEIKRRANQKVREFHEKAVLQYDNDGKPIARFSSIQSAEKKYGSGIWRSCTQGTRTGGYYWAYDDGTDYISKILNGPKGGEKKYKPVNQYDLQGNFIKSFPSVLAAQEEIKVSHIGDVCNGKRKSAGGYKWEWTK